MHGAVGQGEGATMTGRTIEKIEDLRGDDGGVALFAGEVGGRLVEDLHGGIG